MKEKSFSERKINLTMNKRIKNRQNKKTFDIKNKRIKFT